jgi:hypothetical protein
MKRKGGEGNDGRQRVGKKKDRGRKAKRERERERFSISQHEVI